MSTSRFYCPQAYRTGESLRLPPEEAHHAAVVRRLHVGEGVLLFDGEGRGAEAEVVEVTAKREVWVRIRAIHAEADTTPELFVAVAPPKGDRAKTMVDMLTQLGVRGVVPLRCERSAARLGKNIETKWHRVAIAACKQCGRNRLPVIEAATSPAGALERVRATGATVILADPTGANFAHSTITGSATLAVFIGPEGGFSEDEMAYFDRQGVPKVAFSGHILRVETAAVVAAAAVLSAG